MTLCACVKHRGHERAGPCCRRDRLAGRTKLKGEKRGAGLFLPLPTSPCAPRSRFPSSYSFFSPPTMVRPPLLRPRLRPRPRAMPAPRAHPPEGSVVGAGTRQLRSRCLSPLLLCLIPSTGRLQARAERPRRQVLQKHPQAGPGAGGDSALMSRAHDARCPVPGPRPHFPPMEGGAP